MSLSIVAGRGEVVLGDGMVQWCVQRRLVPLLPQQLAGIQRRRRRRQVQQRRRRVPTSVAVRHSAPLPVLHRTGGAAWADPAHARVGPLVRIARTNYHTVVLLGGHGDSHTIRARTATHFTHFTDAHGRLTRLGFRTLFGLRTHLNHITTRTYTLGGTWNNTNNSSIYEPVSRNGTSIYLWKSTLHGFSKLLFKVQSSNIQ